MINKAKISSSDYQEFKYFLKTKNIEILEKRNEEFGIYGIKFRSTKAENPVWFNSSELHRSFSYANLSKHFASVQAKEITAANIVEKTPTVEISKKTTSPVKKVTKDIPGSLSNITPQTGSGVTRKAKVGKLDDDKKKKGGRQI